MLCVLVFVIEVRAPPFISPFILHFLVIVRINVVGIVFGKLNCNLEKTADKLFEFTGTLMDDRLERGQASFTQVVVEVIALVVVDLLHQS